jgi:hypothetical protein
MLWAQPWRGFGRRSWIFFLRCQSTSVSQGSFNLECVEFLKWTVRHPHRSCSWEKVKHKGQWRLWSQHQTYEATVPVQNRWGFPGPGIQVDRKEQKSGIWVGFCFFCPCLLAAIRAFAGMLLRRSLNCTKTLQLLCAEVGHLFTDYCYHVALFRCKDARDCESVKQKKYGKFGNIKLRQLRQVQRITALWIWHRSASNVF